MKKAIMPTIRCAIYTRKSSEEGLQQEFNSLDAQREAAESYIASQKAEGWKLLPDRYDDGGFTGGNIERPALKKLISDIEAGKIDTVIVYKVDRLSRSLMDFARLMETFEKHNVSFVSVTQHFNTTHSMGRLTLNILLSFAQFEREIIGERIRDKIAASRQRGKWTGGTPILGYDVDRSSGSPKLVINPTEASKVIQIFKLYLEHGSLLPVVKELAKRNWLTKGWTTRFGKPRGNFPMDKCRLHKILTNVIYIGKVKHKTEVYGGEHEAIISEDVFRKVQDKLHKNGRAGNSEHRNRHGALLRGLIICKACGKVMSHTFTCKNRRRYRYYVCTNATKQGRQACPSGALPAGEIERAVVDQIRCIGEDPALIAETTNAATAQANEAMKRLASERAILERGISRCHAEIKRIATKETTSEATTNRIADLYEQTGQSERRKTEIDVELATLEGDLVSEEDVVTALADFDNLWADLSPKEQAKVIELLVARVDYDAVEAEMEVSFHPAGIKALGTDAEVTETKPETKRRKEAAA